MHDSVKQLLQSTPGNSVHELVCLVPCSLLASGRLDFSLKSQQPNIRAILQVPFVPFSILFTRAIRLAGHDELSRLEDFSASLQPEASSSTLSESVTHPCRLYTLLCQAARMYIGPSIQQQQQQNPPTADPTLVHPDSFEHFSVVDFGERTDGATGAGDFNSYGLSDWYYGNQQLMQLLDEDVMF